MHSEPAIVEFDAETLTNLLNAALKAWSLSAGVRAEKCERLACEVHDASGYVTQIRRVDEVGDALPAWRYGSTDLPLDIAPRAASLVAVLCAVRMDLEANFRPHSVVMGNSPPEAPSGSQSDLHSGTQSDIDSGRFAGTADGAHELDAGLTSEIARDADLVAPVPVHVLTGFLGSGKTTLLNRLIRDPKLRNSAVVVNEFGDIGVDHLLVSHGQEDAASDGPRLGLIGGCLCCELRDGLALTLVDLLARRQHGQCPHFERIIIETTGLADPLPILNLLATDRRLAERTIAGSVLTVVDVINASDTFERFCEATAQVVVADHIIVTKTDLAAVPGQPNTAPRLTDLVQRLCGMNNNATLHAFGVDDLADLSCLFARKAQAKSIQAFDTQRHPHTHSHTANIHTFTLVRNRALPGAAVTLFVQAMVAQFGPDLLRVKGFVRLVESASQAALLQGAQCVFHPLVPVDVTGQAQEPLSRVVIIVRAPCRDAVSNFAEQLLDALVWEAGEISTRLRQLPSHSGQAAAAGGR
ncbi:MAG: G3E family GTPase [Gammaproteobacteria bacterium]|jgi:G3E family GTPase